jgi:hypothetical protein
MTVSLIDLHQPHLEQVCTCSGCEFPGRKQRLSLFTEGGVPSKFCSHDAEMALVASYNRAVGCLSVFIPTLPDANTEIALLLTVN